MDASEVFHLHDIIDISLTYVRWPALKELVICELSEVRWDVTLTFLYTISAAGSVRDAVGPLRHDMILQKRQSDNSNSAANL